MLNTTSRRRNPAANGNHAPWLITGALLLAAGLPAVNAQQMRPLPSREPCVITDESQPFHVLDAWKETHGAVTLLWESCHDHFYLVQAKTNLTDPSWDPIAALTGEDGWTSWTDANASAFDHRFYRVARLDPAGDFDGDGLSNGAELALGANPTNPDTDGDGLPDGVDAAPLEADANPPSFTVTAPDNNATVYP